MKQFIKFGTVGVINTLIAYFLNIATLYILRNQGLAFDYVIVNYVAFLLVYYGAFIGIIVWFLIQNKDGSRLSMF